LDASHDLHLYEFNSTVLLQMCSMPPASGRRLMLWK
jgi:hypothetical protein